MASGRDDKMLRTSWPLGYRKMISLELSEVKERVQKKKKKRKKSQIDDTPMLEQELTRSGEEEDSEEFYSAPESPLSSDDSSTSDAKLLSPTSRVGLPEAVRKKGAQSKWKKKRKALDRKIARDGFLRPICNLFEDEDSVLAVSDLSLTDLGGVLSLTELCLRKIREIVKSEFAKLCWPAKAGYVDTQFFFILCHDHVILSPYQF